MYLQFHSVKEPSKNLDIWALFLLVLYGVGVSSVGVLAHFTLGSGYVCFLAKPGLWFGSFLLSSGSIVLEPNL